jgi:hypothetical protein
LLSVNAGAAAGQGPVGFSAMYSFMVSGVTAGVLSGGSASVWQSGFYNDTNLLTLQSLYAPQTLSLSTTAGALNYANNTFPSPFGSTTAKYFDAYYSGMINIGTSGTFTLSSTQDDDAAVYIDGKQVMAGSTTANASAWTVQPSGTA